jgi:hypothetical protein
MSAVAARPAQHRAAAPARDNAASWIPPWRAVSAKFMELRRRRGLIVAVLLLTLGIIVVIDAIFIILHATDPNSYGAAGGLRKFRALVFALIDLFGITGAMVGAAAGSSDLSSGVFRHLVVTGRSRLAIYLSWIPAGLMVIVPIAAVTYAIEALVAVFFAPSGNTSTISLSPGAQLGPGAVHFGSVAATPDTHLLVITGLWLMLQVAVAYLLGLGLGALTGSRSVTIVILIAMQLVVTPILSQVSIPHLLNLQRAFVGVAISQIEPSALNFIGGGGGGGGNGGNLLGIPPMPTFGVVTVIVAWIVVFLVVGARRTVRRDA